MEEPKKFVSIADSLAEPAAATEPAPRKDLPLSEQFEDVKDAKDFARRLVESKEFRTYLLDQLVLGDLSAPIVMRLMDAAESLPIPPDILRGPDGDAKALTKRGQGVCRQLVLNPEYLSRVYTRMMTGTLAPAMEMFLWKVAGFDGVQKIEIDDKREESRLRAEIESMTDDQLVARLQTMQKLLEAPIEGVIVSQSDDNRS